MRKFAVFLTTLIAILAMLILNAQTTLGQTATLTCQPITPSNVSELKSVQTIKLQDVIAEHWSADSKTLAVAMSSKIYFFDSQDFSSKELPLSSDEAIAVAAFNSDDSLIAFGTNDIHLLDLVSGKQAALTNLSSALGSNHLKALAFNSDTTQLAAADDDGNIYVSNIASDQIINRVHAGQKFAGSGLFYNADSTRLISFSTQAVAIFDTQTFQSPELYDTSTMLVPPIVTKVSLSSDERILVVLLTYSSNSDANLMFLSEGFVNDLIVSGITHYSDGSTFALSPDGKLIVDSVKNELYIDQLDPQTSLMLNQTVLVVLQGQPSPPKSISFSPDMHYLVSVSQSTGTDPSIHDDGTLLVWGVCPT